MVDNITSPRILFRCLLVCLLFCFATKGLYARGNEEIAACLVPQDRHLSDEQREALSRCLGFEAMPFNICYGRYLQRPFPRLMPGELNLYADSVSFTPTGKSVLSGDVQVYENERMISAQTAYVTRDPKTHQVTEIELLAPVVYEEPDRKIIAKHARFQPQSKTGQLSSVLYRLNHTGRFGAQLPAWGRALYIERFANEDYLLKNTTYSTCAPTDKAWEIQAQEITLDKADEEGYAKHAVLRVQDIPLLYTPFMTFPYTDKRKSGFLMPIYGYSNIGGYDMAVPYYWNIAPNYDATIIPHLYTRRGLMLGVDNRFLTQNSEGAISGHFLPHDRAYRHFLNEMSDEYPWLLNDSSDRWSFSARDHTNWTSQLQMNINYQQVSDDYYLQDFSNNLALMTERQLLKQGDLLYTGENWTFKGLLQGYQTLQPLNQTPVSDVYQRLPQLLADGHYSDLPLSLQFDVLGQVDVFQWPDENNIQPDGPRWHFNPVLGRSFIKSWGYVSPSVEVVENHYDLSYPGEGYNGSFNRFIPRYVVDSGLYFDRKFNLGSLPMRQSLEPRLFYLNVPYQDQSNIPVFDSGYMIFSTNQLFRKNRFSGFDRIGDANQLTYALTSRWLDDSTARERASLTVGQIKYFENRRVGLCQSAEGGCQDSPYMLGYVSPTEGLSPFASHAGLNLNPSWTLSGDYVWDPATHSTNNGGLNLHYQPTPFHLIHLGYTYLVNGDLTQVPQSALDAGALHQGSIALSWPLYQKWSGVGAYQYNISKGYSMMTLGGLQYDSCCWAMRLMGGRAFQSLSPTNNPVYNNSVFFQVLLKGLGTVASSDPSSTIRTFVPGYMDIFHPNRNGVLNNPQRMQQEAQNGSESGG